MTRHVFRPVVASALSVGLRPAIYGSGWHEFVDDDLIVADFVRNEELPVVYSSVGVLLNDHWDTMRTWGFVSNRLFDALACGTPVVSDHLPELSQLFGDAVATYTDAASLGRAVQHALDDPIGARRCADEGRELVLAGHTFDHRATELLDALARHGLDGGPTR
jgi:spore maturation protein CgeB